MYSFNFLTYAEDQEWDLVYPIPVEVVDRQGITKTHVRGGPLKPDYEDRIQIPKRRKHLEVDDAKEIEKGKVSSGQQHDVETKTDIILEGDENNRQGVVILLVTNTVIPLEDKDKIERMLERKRKIRRLREDAKKRRVCRFPECDYIALDRGDLVLHRWRQHSIINIKRSRTNPYVCRHNEFEGCSFKTGSMSTMKNHLESCHGRSFVFQCSECPNYFLHHFEMSQHLLKKHRNKSPANDFISYC